MTRLTLHRSQIFEFVGLLRLGNLFRLIVLANLKRCVPGNIAPANQPQAVMTELIPNFVSFGGVALCAMALLQLAFWSVQTLGIIGENKKQYELARELLRKQIQQTVTGNELAAKEGGDRWAGFRTFRVAKLEQETPSCTSVYLQPDDHKAIAPFRPGQHLTIGFRLTNQSNPIVRCYSLSSGPDEDSYRITVKSAPPPAGQADIPPGIVSNFVNQNLQVDDQVDVKSPAGHFVLDESADSPLVLLAGGIGITPLASMINHLIATESQRKILLVYGVRNSSEHAFKKHFEHLSRCHTNFCLVTCYSSPGVNDAEGVDFHIHGQVSTELIRQILPNHHCQFYLCGPPPFMNSIHAGLVAWGVPDSSIFSEGFGPAAIVKTKPGRTNMSPADTKNSTVAFAASNATVPWNPELESLLELAESNQVPIESGCRVGNCGTCETGLLRGKVSYPENQPVNCSPGTCLVCIARPDGAIELDA